MKALATKIFLTCFILVVTENLFAFDLGKVLRDPVKEITQGVRKTGENFNHVVQKSVDLSAAIITLGESERQKEREKAAAQEAAAREQARKKSEELAQAKSSAEVELLKLQYSFTNIRAIACNSNRVHLIFNNLKAPLGILRASQDRYYWALQEIKLIEEARLAFLRRGKKDLEGFFKLLHESSESNQNVQHPKEIPLMNFIIDQSEKYSINTEQYIMLVLTESVSGEVNPALAFSERLNAVAEELSKLESALYSLREETLAELQKRTIEIKSVELRYNELGGNTVELYNTHKIEMTTPYDQVCQ